MKSKQFLTEVLLKHQKESLNFFSAIRLHVMLNLKHLSLEIAKTVGIPPVLQAPPLPRNDSNTLKPQC